MSATTNIPPLVLASLAERLPELDGLPDEWARGRVCIWCGKPLTAETAIILGEQVDYLDGVRWFPRSCYACTGDRAHQAMLEHGSFCPLCAEEDTAADCDLGRGLYRLQRECRR